MFKPTRVCLSALTKRTKKVKVQILRDFPAFQLYKGQVAQVKPSLMRNYLHFQNGARYILQESDINQMLLAKFAVFEKELEATNAAVQLKTAQQTAKVVSKGQSEKRDSTTTNEDKSVLGKDVSLKDVYIPGLDI